MPTFTENDYKILQSILDRDNKMKGLYKTTGTTIKEIQIKTNLSYKKILVSLNNFEKLGLVKKGMKIRNANTYLLAPLGFVELNSLRKNIFGEEIINGKK